VSPHIEQVLGFSPDEWMADPRLWVDRIHPDDRPDVIDETERCIAAGDPFKLEYRMLAREGRVVWLHDVASVVGRDEAGRSLRYQGLQLDITDRKQAEHAGRRNTAQLRRMDLYRRKLLASLTTTQEAEHRRIAEGLRDETMERLSELLTRLRAIAVSHPEVARLEGFSGFEEELSDVIGGMRDLVIELHPSILETEGLVAALRLHAQRWKTPEAPELVVSDRLTRQPSKQTRSVLYRIAQEALTNVRRHSHASRVTVTVEERDAGFFVRIEDDGEGFDAGRAPDPDHIGLISMRERAEIEGGWCLVQSVRGTGSTVEIWLPEAGSATIESGAWDRARSATPPAPGVEPSQAGPSEIDDLTPRELEVARLLAIGHTNVEISAILFLSVRTIEHHRSQVFRKLGVNSRAALVQKVSQRGPPRADPGD
jgi:two-component system, NarL family, sensor histidine kinase UhpB